MRGLPPGKPVRGAEVSAEVSLVMPAAVNAASSYSDTPR